MNDVLSNLNVIRTACDLIEFDVAPAPEPVVPDVSPPGMLTVGGHIFPVIANQGDLYIVDTAEFFRTATFDWNGNKEQRNQLHSEMFVTPVCVPIIGMHMEEEKHSTAARAWNVTAYAQFSHNFPAACFTWYYVKEEDKWYGLFCAGRRESTYNHTSTPFTLYQSNQEDVYSQYGDKLYPPMSHTYGKLIGLDKPEHQSVEFNEEYPNFTCSCPSNCDEREVSQGIMFIRKDSRLLATPSPERNLKGIEEQMEWRIHMRSMWNEKRRNQ